MNRNENTILEIQHLSKEFGDNGVLNDINLNVSTNEVISIIGPSGAGKSTMLRCLNLLEEPSGGDILYHGNSILDPHFDIRNYRSKVGMVFQSFNLFNNKKVLQNVTTGQVSVLGRSQAEAEAKAIDVLKQVGMAEYIDAMPSQISGGQQQRIAIARALAMDCEIILFDEPTSALDPEMVGEVLEVMQGLAAKDLTMIIVTHEMTFARDVSSKVCFMQNGVLEEVGSPDEIFYNPQSPNLQQFLSKVKMT